MNYRLDSDIPFPYGKVIKLNSSIKTATFNSSSPKRKKAVVAWTASHCFTQSRREEFVTKLKRYIKVDTFGDCGSHTCLNSSSKDPGCLRELEKTYKFYLALENSLCADYVTEKFYNALNSNMIPVVYGYANYSKIAPLNSFIDARQFKSIQLLANYLTFLSNHPQEYKKYFEWKSQYKVMVDTMEDNWCSLCDKIDSNKMNNNEWKDRKSYEDIALWTLYKKILPNPQEACIASKF